MEGDGEVNPVHLRRDDQAERGVAVTRAEDLEVVARQVEGNEEGERVDVVPVRMGNKNLGLDPDRFCLSRWAARSFAVFASETPTLSLPGFARAYARTSFIVLNRESPAVATTLVNSANPVNGVKSPTLYVNGLPSRSETAVAIALPDVNITIV